MAIAGTHGWIVPLPEVTTTDFASFYAAGKLAAGADPAAVYDLARHHQAEIAATGAIGDYKYFFYPPVFLLLLAPLSHLPYLAAFYGFEILPLLALLWMLRGNGAWMMLAVPSLYWCLGQGQNSLLSAVLFAAGLLAIDKRPWAAGLAFGMLCYKPHLGLVLPFALIAGGYGRCLFATAVTVTGLVGISVARFGVACWIAFWGRFRDADLVFINGQVHYGALTSVFGAALNLGLAARWAWVLHVAAAVAAIVAVVIIWRRRPGLPYRGASLVAATLIAMPVVLYYDLAIAALAVIWLMQMHINARWFGSALLLCFAIDLVGYPIALWLHMSIAAVICPVLLGLVLAASRVRAAAGFHQSSEAGDH